MRSEKWGNEEMNGREMVYANTTCSRVLSFGSLSPPTTGNGVHETAALLVVIMMQACTFRRICGLGHPEGGTRARTLRASNGTKEYREL